jgi:hypothetical protein
MLLGVRTELLGSVHKELVLKFPVSVGFALCSCPEMIEFRIP